MTETNPFRLSMLQRSHSPEDPFAESEYVQPQNSGDSIGPENFQTAPLVSNNTNPFYARQQQYVQPQAQYVQPSQPQYVQPVQPVQPQPQYVQPVPQPQYVQPVQQQLSGGAQPARSPNAVPAAPAPRGGTLLEPPSYVESERRHSDPNLTRPDDEKSQLVARDDSYREGYEEGMRIARERERQRRREYRERRLRSSGSTREAPPSSSTREHSSRESAREAGIRDAMHSESSSHRRREHGSSSGSRERSSGRSRSKSESAGGSSRRRSKPNQSLDVIDKLDATGSYGGLGGFHHDGPFDACTPHRNSGKSKRNVPAPVAAFHADGPNNSLAVENPALASYRKDEAVFGRDIVDLPPEASQQSFDPTDRGAKVHGERTFGLGSTTFIDGTPASRDAQKAQLRTDASGLGRSRSLLRRQPSARRHTIDEDIEEEAPKSLLSRVRSLRVGKH